MSGICGLFNLDGSPIAVADARSMCAMLEQRGPDATGVWRDGAIAFGHTLLATTPEAEHEQQPFRHPESDCVITADVRLDNRPELLKALAPNRDARTIGDPELVLLAYLKWGQDCPIRLLGDFAFAIWDPRHRHTFCARDHFGMRPFYYHYASGQRFAFGSSPDAILVLPAVPYEFDEGRIADYLVQELEWVDYTSTFYVNVFRLPPAHRALISMDRLRVEPYWHPTPTPSPGSMSDDDWRDGLIEQLTVAVDARLRTPDGQVGSMLSGGLDSGSVVAVARDLLQSRNAGDLPTFSAVCGSTDVATQTRCAESLAIFDTVRLPHIRATLITPDAALEDLEQLLTDCEEPFDTGFMFLKVIYAAASEQGVRTVLDGGGGDVVFGEGSYVSRLIRAGQWRRAYAEIKAESQCIGGGQLHSLLLRYARAALVPELIKQPARRISSIRRYSRTIEESLVSTELAHCVDLHGRFERMRKTFANVHDGDYALETMNSVLPNMTAGKERYARLAASCAVEARDPFMDKRLVEFCAHIPGHLRMENYQHKLILRQIMDGRVPNSVAWTARKPHIGWLFNQAVKKQLLADGQLGPDRLRDTLGDRLDQQALAKGWREFEHYGYNEEVNTALCLSVWLRQKERRPAAKN